MGRAQPLTRCMPPLQRGQLPEEPEPRWGLFDFEAYSKPWAVPWGAKTVVGGMTLWATSFIIVGVVLLPLIGYTFGIKVRTAACSSHHLRG